MINSSLDLVPPIRGLESFSFIMFFCNEGWLMAFFLELASIFFFSGLEEEMLSQSFREIVL